MNTLVSGVRLPPEWLPTSSTGPSAGMRSRPRTSAAEPEAREQPQAAAATRGCSRGRARRGRPWARRAWAWRATALSGAADQRRGVGSRAARAGVGSDAAVGPTVALRHARCCVAPEPLLDPRLPGVCSSVAMRLTSLAGFAQAARRGAAAGHELRPRLRRPVGQPDLVRLAGRQTGQQLRAPRRSRSCSRRRCACAVSITSLRRAPLIRLRPITARSSASAGSGATSVPPARTRLASCPAAGPTPAGWRERRGRAGRRRRAALARGGGVQADHEVEVLAAPAGRGWRPSARRRPRSRGRRCAPGGRSRGSRTRRPRRRPARPAGVPRRPKRHAPAGRVVARDRPEARVVDPLRWAPPGARCPSSESVDTSPRGSHPTVSPAACGASG